MELIEKKSDIRISEILVKNDGTLSRDGQTLRLAPREHALLQCLVGRAGSVVTQQQILAEVWKESIVVEPDSVYQAIKRLRKALDSLQPDTRFIETIPKRGYRLLAPIAVEPQLRSSTDSPVESVPAVATTAREPIVARQSRRAWMLGWTGAGAILAGGGIILRDGWSKSRARELHREGLKLWSTRRYFACVQALKKFEEAVRLDSQFALGWVGIANCHLFGAVEAPEAEAAIRKALSIDPACGEAYSSLGFLNMVHRWNWPAAQTNFDRALQLAPQDPTTNHWFATYHSCLRRFELAHDGLVRAAKLDPDSPAILSDLLRVRFQLGEQEAALQGWQELRQRNFGFAVRHLVWHLCALKRYEEAIILHIKDASAVQQQERLRFLKEEGWVPAAEQIIESLDPIGSAYQIAQWNAILGRDVQCMRKLKQAASADRFPLFEINLDVAFDRMRGLDSFQSFLAEIRMPSLT